MTTETVGYVDAVFGGERLRFELDRKDIPGLEAMLGGSAYQVFTKFAGGFWTIRDLEGVLSASVPAQVEDAADRNNRAMLFKMARMMGESGFSHGAVSPYVQGVLRKNPPARYAVLAMRVLEASLFGIAQADASFDETDMVEAA